MKSWLKHFPKEIEKLGFPAPLLGDENWRLPVLASGSEWWMLFKPAGCVVAPDVRMPEFPSLTEAWDVQFRQGKPEFVQTGLSKVKSVYPLDPEIHGPVLLAGDGAVLESLRNSFGSDQFLFQFEFLATDGGVPVDDFEVDLPIQIKEDEVRVTHRHGKKSITNFHRVKRWGKLSLWQATTRYPRLFQVRIHAWESRLRILGETRMGRVGQLFLSRLKKQYVSREEELPLLPGLAMRLASVQWAGNSVECPPLSPWATALKKLDEYGYPSKPR
jgi:23S rRNA-/tRNA-specific pseudouridylate synthase